MISKGFAPVNIRCGVVIASGRCALEALSVGKPVLAFGRGGFQGQVTPERWQLMRETNFGDHGNSAPITPEGLAGELDQLLTRLGKTHDDGGVPAITHHPLPVVPIVHCQLLIVHYRPQRPTHTTRASRLTPHT